MVKFYPIPASTFYTNSAVMGMVNENASQLANLMALVQAEMASTITMSIDEKFDIL